MARPSFTGGVDYSSVFAGLYRSAEDQAKAQASQASNIGSYSQASQPTDPFQASQDADMQNQWQNNLITDDQWLAYLNTRAAATVGDPQVHEQFVQLQRQVGKKVSDAATAAKQAEQDASDANTYDQWKNGQISDQDWLDYLGKRVTDTGTSQDPAQVKAHEQFVELQRQYTTSIGDTQAQNAYQNHTMSAASYIAYLRQSMAGMDAGSQAYRDRAGIVQQVIDTQLASDTQARATELTAGIAAGKNSLEQLISLYQGAKAKARPGTDLYNQLTTNIGQAQDQLTSRDSQGALNKVEYLFNANKLTGKEAAAQIAGIADKYFKNDPSKYYSILNSSTQYGKYGGNTQAMGAPSTRATGGGGGGGGGNTTGGVGRGTLGGGVTGHPSSAGGNYDRAHLADLLSSLTGLDYRVAYTWLAQEGVTPQSYYANRNNPLGIKNATDTGSGYKAGVGPNSEVKNDPYAGYNSPEDGIRAAAWVLNTFGRYKPVLAAVKAQDPQAQVQALINSGWASSHYGGSWSTVPIQPRPTGAASAAGGNVGPSYTGGGSPKETKAVVAALQANIDRGVAITDQYLNNGDAPIVDPANGKPIARDPALIHQIQVQTLASYDQISKVYNLTGRASDAKTAADWSKRKIDFIQKAIVPVNTLGPQKTAQEMITTMSAHLAALEKSGADPLTILQETQKDSATLKNYIASLTRQTVGGNSTTGHTGPAPAVNQPDPKFIQEITAVATAFDAISQPGMTSDQTQAALDFLKKTTGTYIPDSVLTDVVKGVVASNVTYTGIQSGALSYANYVATSGPNKGQLVMGPVPLKDSFIPPAGGNPATTEKVPDLPLNTKAREQWTQVYMNVNGKPTEVWAKIQPQVYTKDQFSGPDTPQANDTGTGNNVVFGNAYKVWIAKQAVTLYPANGQGGITIPAGSIIPSYLIGASSGPSKNPGTKNEAPGLSWDDYVTKGEIAQAPADMGLTRIETPGYADGGKNFGPQTWLGDPKTGTWYLNTMPFTPQFASDGSVLVSQDGTTVSIAKPNATAGGVPVPYVGDNPKLMQGIWNAGLGVGGGSQMAMAYDSTGKLVPVSRDYYSTAYYDPSLEANARAADASAQTWDHGSADLGGAGVSASGNLDSNWWKNDIQALKVSASRQQETTLYRSTADRNQNRGQTVNSLPDFSTMAKAVGITGVSLGQGAGATGSPTSVQATGTIPPPSTSMAKVNMIPLPPISQPKANSAVGVGATASIPVPPPAPSVKLADLHIPIPPPPHVTTAPAKISMPAPVVSPKPAPAPAPKPAPVPAPRPTGPSQDLLGTGHPVPPPAPPKSIPNPTPIKSGPMQQA